jgi:hypothetical protein
VTPQSVKTAWLVSPERLRPARFSTLRSSEADCGPCYVRAICLAPFSPDPVSNPPSRGHCRTVLPTASLGSPLGSPRTWWKDASHRSLQPTIDTCTRRSVRFPGAMACATADHGVLGRGEPTSPSRRQTTLRQSSPGSYALDGAQTSFGHARSRRFRMRSPIKDGDPRPRVIDIVGVVHHPEPACSAGRRVDERSSDALVARHRTPSLSRQRDDDEP